MSFNNTINEENFSGEIIFYVLMIPFMICGLVIIYKFISFILQCICIFILNIFYRLGIEKCNPDLWFKDKGEEEETRTIRIIETKIYKFEENENENKELNCSICLGDFELEEEIVILSCKHEFHKLCAQQWFRENIGKNQTCPNCRNNLKYLIV